VLGGGVFWRIHLALHWFESLLPPLTRVLSLLVPKELYLTLDWRRHFGCDLHIANCAKKKRELSCCLNILFGGGDGTVTAGSLFAAADKLLLESSCFLPHPLLCWHRITGGVLPGWHVIVGDNQSGTNRQVWYFMGVRSHQVWYFMGVSLIMDHPWVVVKGAQVWYLASFRNRTLSR
jgi:hypothetical protein